MHCKFSKPRRELVYFTLPLVDFFDLACGFRKFFAGSRLHQPIRITEISETLWLNVFCEKW